MTDLRQAAQRLVDRIDRDGASPLDWSEYNALLAALEQQAEPVLLECVTCGTVYADGVPPQVPVQQQAEPVAYLCENAVGHKYFRWKKPSSTYKPIALYTTPPQRQWVSLTDEEILRADPRFGKSESDVNPYQILGSAQDLEAKLKERNGY